MPGVDVTGLGNWLRQLVENGVAVESLSTMETLRLACQALADLRQPAAPHAAARIAALRGPGGLYSFEVGLPTSWGATNAAVDALLAANLTVPSDLVDMTRSQLPATTADSSLTPNGSLQQLLPQWQIADRLLPAIDRAPFRAQLMQQLVRLAQAIASFPPEGVVVFVAASAVQIANTNGLSLHFSSTMFSSLARSDGMLTSFTQYSQPDPKTTYYAAVAGRPAPPTLASGLRRTAGPRGWRLDVGLPDPQSSFYAAAIIRALGGHVPAKELLQSSSDWLQEGLARYALSPDTELLKNAFFALQLSGFLGARPPQAFVAAINAAQPVLASASVEAVLWGALLVAHCGLPLIPALFDAAQRAVLHLDTTRTSTLGLAWSAVRELRMTSAESSLRVLGVPSQLGVAYAAREGIAVADINSTTVGFMANPGSVDLRARAAQLFADRSGYWFVPPRFRNGNVVDLRTLYLGMWLSGRLPQGLTPAL